MLLADFKRLYSNAYRGHMSTFTLRIYTHLNSMDISNEIIMCTYEQISSERQCPNER